MHHHVVVEVVHDPDGENDNDENDGNGGCEDHQVPAGAFLSQDVQEKNGLARRL